MGAAPPIVEGTDEVPDELCDAAHDLDKTRLAIVRVTCKNNRALDRQSSTDPVGRLERGFA